MISLRNIFNNIRWYQEYCNEISLEELLLIEDYKYTQIDDLYYICDVLVAYQYLIEDTYSL